MVDVPSMLIGAGITLFSVIAGAGLSFLHAMRKREPVKESICGCHHHRSFHEDSGKCHARDPYGREECGCVTYLGPEYYPEDDDE